MRLPEWRRFFTGGQAERDRRDAAPVRGLAAKPRTFKGMPVL